MSVGVEPTRTGLQPVAWPSGFDIVWARGVDEPESGMRVDEIACDHHTPRTCKRDTGDRNRFAPLGFLPLPVADFTLPEVLTILSLMNPMKSQSGRSHANDATHSLSFRIQFGMTQEGIVDPETWATR